MITQFETQLRAIIQRFVNNTGTEDAVLAKYFGDTLTALNILRAGLGVPDGVTKPSPQ